jgi:hypothetical protein
MTEHDDRSTRTKLPKRTASNGGREVAARPVGRPVLEAQDRYSDQLAEHCRDEIERLVELTVANRLRTRFRFEQQKIERRIDRLLGQDQEEEE